MQKNFEMVEFCLFSPTAYLKWSDELRDKFQTC